MTNTDSSTKLAFVCSPYRGDTGFNVRCAEIFCRWIVENNADTIPFAPHIYFTRFLKDDSESERILGIKYGLDMLALCDEVYVFKLNGYMTDGMAAEVDVANKMGKKVIVIGIDEIQDILAKYDA